MPKYLVCVLLAGMVLAGCGDGQVQVSKDQENAFRNPPKEPPAGAQQGMSKAMENAGKNQNSNK